MNIRTRLVAYFLLVVGIFALCGLYTISQVRSVGSQSKQFIAEYWPTTDLIMETRIEVDGIAAKVMAPAAAEGAEEKAIAEAQATIKKLQEAFQATKLATKDINNAIQLLSRVGEALVDPIHHFRTPGEKMEEADAAVGPVLAIAKGLGDSELINTIWEAVMAFNDILITGDPAEREAFDEHTATIETHPRFTDFEATYGPFKAKGTAVFDAADKLIYAQRDFRQAQQALALGLEELEARYAKTVVNPGAEQVLADIKSVLIAVPGAVLIGALLSILIGIRSAHQLSKPIAQVMHMIEELGKGNLDQRLNMGARQDELGRMARGIDAFADNLKDEILTAFQKLAEGDFTFKAKGLIREPLAKANAKLNELVGQIQNSANQIAAGANQVSDSSQSISQGATEQASSLEQITASTKEIAAQTKCSAQNASQAKLLSDQTKNAAAKGNDQMQEMVAAMKELNDAGQSIEKIIKVIDEIAFQTNLLALNAAVEAARAGQHGKGFAVVAEEVRNLAGRSAKAARETAEIIEGTVAKTEKGMETSGKAVKALEEIIAGVAKTSELVAGIAAASNDQALGVGQIDGGLGQIEQATQQSTAGAEESAAAAEELASQASLLQEMLAHFKVENQTGVQQFAGKIELLES